MRHWGLILESDERLRRLERQHHANPSDETRQQLTTQLRRAGRHDDANRVELRPHAEALQAAHANLVERGPKYGVGERWTKAHTKIWHAARELLEKHNEHYRAAWKASIQGRGHGHDDGPSPMAMTTETVHKALDPSLSSKDHFVRLLGKLHGSIPVKPGKTHHRLDFYPTKDAPRLFRPAGPAEFRAALDHHKVGRVVQHRFDNSDQPDHLGRVSHLGRHQLTVNHQQHGKHAEPEEGPHPGRWDTSPYNQDPV